MSCHWEKQNVAATELKSKEFGKENEWSTGSPWSYGIAEQAEGPDYSLPLSSKILHCAYYQTELFSL